MARSRSERRTGADELLDIGEAGMDAIKQKRMQEQPPNAFGVIEYSGEHYRHNPKGASQVLVAWEVEKVP